jgi:thiosulfate dehydrogenase
VETGAGQFGRAQRGVFLRAQNWHLTLPFCHNAYIGGSSMGKFILGVIVTLLVLILGGLGFAMLGFFPTRADVPPPNLENRLANSALDASMERHASRVTNPLPPTDQNLEDGMKIYTMNCALCHGGLDRKPSALANAFYPPPPNLVTDPPDDPEWHLYYAIRTGVRYTGMPAWEKMLSEQDIWKVTSLLSHLEKLPPGVQDYYQKNFGVIPEAGGEEKKDEKKDDKKEHELKHDHH